MIRRGFLALVVAAGLATGASAQDAGTLVIEVDGSVVLGSPGPHERSASAVTAMMKPLITQRTV